MKRLFAFLTFCCIFVAAFSGSVSGATGDIVAAYSLSGNDTGLVWKDGYIFNIDHGGYVPAHIRKIDPATGGILETQELPVTDVMGLTWDGGNYWAISHQGAYLYEFDSAWNVIRTIRTPGPAQSESSPKGLAFDGRYLWFVDWVPELNGMGLIKMDPETGAIIRTFPAPTSGAEGLTWDGKYLWLSEVNNRLYKIDPADGSVVRTIDMQGFASSWAEGDLAFDGQYIWMSRNSDQRIYKIDAGIIPKNCAGIHSANPGAPDGDYVIEPSTGRVFTVYCHDMAGGAPREYLTLANTGGDLNFGQFTAARITPGDNIRTNFTKVRLDPVTLQVDIFDLTFAVTTGVMDPGGHKPLTFYPYASAGDCSDSGIPTGVGNINLIGTPFNVNDTFTVVGYYPNGSAVFNENHQIVDLLGGGYCGGIAPAAAVHYGMSNEGNHALQLAYCPQPSSGLAGWWPGEGNAQDIIGGNNGTLQNGATFAVGKVGQAFRFTADNDRVELGNPKNLQLSGGDFSVDAWVNYDLADLSTDGAIVSKMGDYPTVNGDGWILARQADNHFWFCFGGGGDNGCTPTAATTVISATMATNGTWYHIAGVKSGNEFAIYVNGIKEASKPLPTLTDTDAYPAFIGDSRLRHQMLGLIDEVGIYNRALSAADIQGIYYAGGAGLCKPAADVDNDHDGYGAAIDCNDNDPLEHPEQVWYKDADNDGYSDGASVTQCARPAGYKAASELTAISGDCNDSSAAVHPGAAEIRGDGIDQDCNGSDDPYYHIINNATGGDCSLFGSWNQATLTCTLVADISDGVTLNIESDNVTLDGNGRSMNGYSPGYGVTILGKTGVTIKNLNVSNYACGILLYGSSGNTITNSNSSGNGSSGISLQAGSNNNRILNSMFDKDSSAAIDFQSSDNNLVVGNTASGTLDGIKFQGGSGNQIYHNNVIGNVRQLSGNNGNVFGDASTGGNYWADFDSTQEGCSDADRNGFCDAPYGPDNFPWTAQDGWVDADGDGYNKATDCNDNNASIHPGAAEIPYNGIDENCNGMADDDDLDHDGYGLATDCNDNNASIHPDAVEIPYNGIDENCNGIEDDAAVVYNPANGHWYTAVAAAGNWDAANAAAQQMTYRGITGHLATLTSEQENTFVATSLPASASGSYWLGGYQDRSAPDYVEPAGGWRWVTGEAWSYTNWSGNEPNDSGPEDYLLFNVGPGWNDGKSDDTSYRGYVVEFDSPDSPSQSARVDLALEWGDITFWQNGVEVTNPGELDSVVIKAKIHNLSTDATSSEGTVSFHDTYVTGNRSQELLGAAPLPAVAPNGTATVELTWTPNPQDPQPDFHLIQVSVARDPAETYTDNNVATHHIVRGTRQAAGNVTIDIKYLNVSDQQQMQVGARFTLSGYAQYHWQSGYTLPVLGGKVTVRLGDQTYEARTGSNGWFYQEVVMPLAAGCYPLTIGVSDATITGAATLTLCGVSVPYSGPDLYVPGISVANAVAEVPDTVYAYIANRGGDVAAGSFTNHIEITGPNGQTVFTDTTTYDNAGGIVAGSGVGISFAGWTPSVAGNYRITVTTDFGGSITESNEDNNTTTIVQYVYPHYADIDVAELRQSCNVISARIANHGGMASQPGTLRITDGGTEHTVTLSSIAGKNDYGVWVEGWAYPGNQPDTLITVTADVAGDPNSGNNTRSGRFDFTSKSDPTITNLRVNNQYWWGANTVYKGVPNTLDAEVHNLGCLGAAGTVQFYLDGTPLGDPQALSELVGGGITTVSVTNSFADKTAGANYTLSATVVAGAGYTDAVPGNNTYAETLLVSPQLPDYRVSSDDIHFALNHPRRNEQFLISADIHNVGLAEGSDFTVAFYEDGKTLIGAIQTITDRPIAPGSFITVSPVDANGSVMNWGSGVSGNHAIMVVVAPTAGIQNDPNDNDNSATRKVWVNYPPRVKVSVVDDSTRTVSFSAAGSDDGLDTDGLGGVVGYEWNFGDGATVSTTGPAASHTYALGGNYAVTVTVGDTSTETSTASVDAAVPYRITASAGAGGTISPSGDVYASPGASAAFTVTPDANYHIAGVEGCGGTLSGNLYTTAVTSADCTITASFAIDSFIVTPVAGEHGSISPSTPQTVNYGQTLSLTVTPDTGYHIASVNGCGIVPNGGAYTTAAVTENCTVTAAFLPNQYSLSVIALGGGVVTSSPAGISCRGDATCTGLFDYPTQVTLTASSNPDAYFVGWSGACTGTGNCTVAMTANTTVNAEFAKYIRISDPKGGDVWSKGRRYTINWKYGTGAGPLVKIELLKGGSPVLTISDGVSIGSAGSGSYSWTVPSTQTTGSDYSIRLTSTSNANQSGTSNGYFTIR